MRNHSILITLIAIASMTAEVHAQDAMFVDSAGNVGVGTNAPSTALHVLRADGTAKLFVEETSSTVGPRELFQVSNNGGAAFIFEDVDNASRYEFTNFSSNFVINKQGSSGPKLVITSDNRLSFQNKGTSTELMQVKPNGDVVIAGTLSQGSSRAVKLDRSPVDTVVLLDKVQELGIAEWSYASSQEHRHIGPMAEEFYTKFSLGRDRQHIAPGDLAGVSLGAIQQLSTLIEKKEARIRQLEARLARIEAMLADDNIGN